MHGLRQIVLWGCLLVGGQAWSQTSAGTVRFDEDPAGTGRLQGRFDERFAVMDSVVFRLPGMLSEPLSDSTFIGFVVNERVEALDRVVDAQIAAMKHRTGLEITGQTYVRPGANVSYDPDDPLVAYNAKAQVELEWDIFQSSIYKRASKIRELELQGEIRQLEYEKEGLAETIFLQKKAVRYRYYGQLLAVLNLHAENLRLLMETQRFLLMNGKISSDDLLRLISEQAEIERQLIAIQADSVVSALPLRPGAALITVADTAALMADIRAEQTDLKRLNLRSELLDARRRNIDYLQTMHIAPFARFSYYNRANARNTHNLDIGLAFRIPLSAETSKKRQALRAEQAVVQYEIDRLDTDVEREVTELLRDLESSNENIRGEYERMSGLKEYLRMRIESYGNVAGEYSRIDRLQEYNAWLQAWERLLAYAYRRDCTLIDLQGYVTEKPLGRHLVFRELN